MTAETIPASAPLQAIPGLPSPANALGFHDAQLKQINPPNDLELLHPPATSHSSATSESFQSTGTTDQDHAQQNAESEEEHTLSAYGDIQEDVIAPPSPAPTLLSNPSPLQSRFSQPRLRLRVRRPPMPKRRVSHNYVPDPKSYAGIKDRDERCPGIPRPAAKNQPWLQRQPLVSPIHDHPTTPKSQKKEKKSTKKSGSSLEKLFDELLPHSPSIRLSPPGSPAKQVVSLPQETRGQKQKDVQQGQNQRAREASKSAKPQQSSPAPTPRQDKLKSAAWRTRLPPRLPIPKWDM